MNLYRFTVFTFFTIVWIFFGIFISSVVDKRFPKFDKNKKKIWLIYEVLLQNLVINFCTYYFTKILSKMVTDDKLIKSTNRSLTGVYYTPILLYTQREFFKKIKYLIHMFNTKFRNPIA